TPWATSPPSLAPPWWSRIVTRRCSSSATPARPPSPMRWPTTRSAGRPSRSSSARLALWPRSGRTATSPQPGNGPALNRPPRFARPSPTRCCSPPPAAPTRPSPKFGPGPAKSASTFPTAAVSAPTSGPPGGRRTSQGPGNPARVRPPETGVPASASAGSMKVALDSAVGRDRLQSAPDLRRVHGESTEQHRGRIWWLESEDPGQYLLGRDLGLAAIGLDRFLEHFLRRGRHAEAVFVHDVSERRLLRHGARRQRGSVGAGPHAQGTQGFLIERRKGLASVLQAHAEHGLDRGILQQCEEEVIGAGSAITSATRLLTGPH